MAGFLCGLTGCTAEDKAGVSIDLTNLNWQTIALFAAALLTPFQSLLKPVMAALQPIISILQKLGLTKTSVLPDDKPEPLTTADISALIARTDEVAIKTLLLQAVMILEGVAPDMKGAASASTKSK